MGRETQCYPKAEKCRLLSRAVSVVVQGQENTAQTAEKARPLADNRAVLNGIWYVLWTGCQWKAVHRDWFGVCSSTLHERFQTWQQLGIFDQISKSWWSSMPRNARKLG